MARKPKIEIEGAKQLKKLLDTYGEKVFRKATRQGIRNGASLINKAAKQNAPKESGALKKSLGVKLLTNKRTKNITGMVGVRAGHGADYNGKFREPWQYDHLVEYGHVSAGGGQTPAQPFLRPAWESKQGQALKAVRDKMRQVIEKEGRKAKK